MKNVGEQNLGRGMLVELPRLFAISVCLGLFGWSVGVWASIAASVLR